MKDRLAWHNETRKVNDLIPNPENPRRMSEKQTEELKKELGEIQSRRDSGDQYRQ